MTNYRNIHWQCRRGMLELDVIFQHFSEHRYPHLSAEHKKLFAELLKQDDPTLYDWLITEVPCTDVTLQPIVSVIIKEPL
ncbi:MAG: hypothetical protein ACD_42C00471G0002 [uncultured bacterium]|nr:MAG: hypothetical protein ACD_42C00471G0002 [uncultured bacterium]